MFDLVADVEHYPEFVPLCRSLRVRKRTSEGEGKEVIVASMTVAYKFLHESFTSRVTLERGRLEILVEYLEGPFQKMNNRRNSARRRRCPRRRIPLLPTSSSRTLGVLMGAMFETAFRRFSAAFERRADEVYGASPA